VESTVSRPINGGHRGLFTFPDLVMHFEEGRLAIRGEVIGIIGFGSGYRPFFWISG
jgi:hypothetical protein